MKKAMKIGTLLLAIAAFLTCLVQLCLRLRNVVTNRVEDEDDSFSWMV